MSSGTWSSEGGGMDFRSSTSSQGSVGRRDLAAGFGQSPSQAAHGLQDHNVVSLDAQKPSVFEALNGQDSWIRKCLSNPSPGSEEALQKVIDKQQQDISLARGTIEEMSGYLRGLKAGFACLRELYEDAWKNIGMNQRAFDQCQMGTNEDVTAGGHIAEIMEAASNLARENRTGGMTAVSELIRRRGDRALNEVGTIEALLEKMKLDVSKADKTLRLSNGNEDRIQ